MAEEIKENEAKEEIGEKDPGEDSGDVEKKEGEEEDGKDFEVEKILNRKKSKGQWLYLVRWAGFDDSEDTWEPLENLAGFSVCPVKPFNQQRESKYDIRTEKSLVAPQKPLLLGQFDDV